MMATTSCRTKNEPPRRLRPRPRQRPSNVGTRLSQLSSKIRAMRTIRQPSRSGWTKDLRSQPLHRHPSDPGGAKQLLQQLLRHLRGPTLRLLSHLRDSCHWNLPLLFPKFYQGGPQRPKEHKKVQKSGPPRPVFTTHPPHPPTPAQRAPSTTPTSATALRGLGWGGGLAVWLGRLGLGCCAYFCRSVCLSLPHWLKKQDPAGHNTHPQPYPHCPRHRHPTLLLPSHPCNSRKGGWHKRDIQALGGYQGHTRWADRDRQVFCAHTTETVNSGSVVVCTGGSPKLNIDWGRISRPSNCDSATTSGCMLFTAIVI